MALDQILVEGFSAKHFKAQLDRARIRYEVQWGSLKLLEGVLKAIGSSDEQAKEIVTPLRELHELRNILKGHGAVDKRRKVEQQAIKDFKTLRAHFIDLAERCNDSLIQVRNALELVLTE